MHCHSCFLRQNPLLSFVFLEPFVEIDALSLCCFLVWAILNCVPVAKIRGLGANPEVYWQTVKRVACMWKSGGERGWGERKWDSFSPFPFRVSTPPSPSLFSRRPLRHRREQLLVAQCYIVCVKLRHDYPPALTRLSTLNVHLFVFQHGPGQTQAVHQRVGGSETGFCFTTAKETTRSILKRCASTSSGHPVSKSIEPLHETSGMDAYGFCGNGGALRPEFCEALDLVINTFSERVGCQVASLKIFYILSLYYGTQFW